MRIIRIEREDLQDSLHRMDRSGQEEWNMTWMLLAALVGVVVLSVRDQLNRERDAACLYVLAR